MFLQYSSKFFCKALNQRFLSVRGKENKTPWQLAREKVPNLDKRLLMIPPIDLDAVIRLDQPFSDNGGNDVLTVPFSKKTGYFISETGFF